MTVFTLNPQVEASNILKIYPASLPLPDLIELRDRSVLVLTRMMQETKSIGPRSGPESGNLRYLINRMTAFITVLNGAIAVLQAAAVVPPVQGQGFTGAATAAVTLPKASKKKGSK